MKLASVYLSVWSPLLPSPPDLIPQFRSKFVCSWWHQGFSSWVVSSSSVAARVLKDGEALAAGVLLGSGHAQVDYGFSCSLVRTGIFLHTVGLEGGPCFGQHVGLVRMVGLLRMDHA